MSHREPRRHPLLALLGLFALIALSFAIYGLALFVLIWLALKFAS